jgi:prepilin-type N-terminal cleavage/methylation domain-containing protein
MNRPQIQRGAFTLVELLVVIAIVGVLIGLLLPAVQKVRDVAARAKCGNNLRQVAIALHHYHDVRQSFPSGYVSGVAANGGDTGPGWGWAAFILPQMEQSALFSYIRFDKPIKDPANASARIVAVPSYICPSDRAAPTWFASRYDPSGALQR